MFSRSRLRSSSSELKSALISLANSSFSSGMLRVLMPFTSTSYVMAFPASRLSEKSSAYFTSKLRCSPDLAPRRFSVNSGMVFSPPISTMTSSTSTGLESAFCSLSLGVPLKLTTGHGLRILPQRHLRRAQLFRAIRRLRAAGPAQPVRRHRRRTGRQEPHLLLRRLSGNARQHRHHPSYQCAHTGRTHWRFLAEQPGSHRSVHRRAVPQPQNPELLSEPGRLGHRRALSCAQPQRAQPELCVLTRRARARRSVRSAPRSFARAFFSVDLPL